MISGSILQEVLNKDKYSKMSKRPKLKTFDINNNNNITNTKIQTDNFTKTNNNSVEKIKTKDSKISELINTKKFIFLPKVLETSKKNFNESKFSNMENNLNSIFNNSTLSSFYHTKNNLFVNNSLTKKNKIQDNPQDYNIDTHTDFKISGYNKNNYDNTGIKYIIYSR